MTTPKKDTPKRKFSPTAGTPLGRVRKMSTNVEASPKLRGQLILHDLEDMLPQSDRAPDLMAGIGRLEIRGVQSEQNINIVSVGSLEATGLAPRGTVDETKVPSVQHLEIRGKMSATRPSSPPMNITQRLMMQAGRKRTLSLGGKKMKSRNTSYARPRTMSLGSQKKIDQIFDQTTKGIRDIDKFKSNTTTS